MKNNKSFTLDETLAVITIIGILSGFLILRFQESNYEAELSRAKAFSLSVLMSLPVETVSEWKFDGPTTAGSSATLDDVKDTWGANDGTTVSGGILVKDGNDCIFGKCLQFNGSDYVDIADISDIELADTTFSFWGKINNFTKDHGFIYKGAHDTNQPLCIWFDLTVGGGDKGSGNTKTISVLTFDGSIQHWIAAPTNSVNNINWNYFVIIINPTDNKIKIYINGNLAEENIKNWNGVNNTLTALRLGNPTPTSSQGLDGFLDDVRIFNAALTVSQINQMYLAGLDGLYLSNQIPKEEYNQRLSELKMNLTKYE